MAITRSAPFPIKDPIAQPRTGLLSKAWIDWFTNLIISVDASPANLQTVELAGTQAASIGTTVIPTGALGAGLYRVTYAARVTQAATVSSSLIITFGWTDTTAKTFSFPGMTGNTTGTTDSGTRLVRVTAASPLTYSTTYASVGATPMQYGLDVMVERVGG